MKLGDKVLFAKYYRKNRNWVTYDEMTKEQIAEFEEDDCVVLARLDEVTLTDIQEGIIAGKRKLIKTTTYGLGTYQYNPDGDDTWLPMGVETVDVYLVATGLSGFYRVPEEWLQCS